MSISEEWPEFVTPEAIARNTGVWPIGQSKPRLRWRHRDWGDWMVRRDDGAQMGGVIIQGLDGSGGELVDRAPELKLYRFATNDWIGR